ncbi:MAG TPA: TfoX/Sxy family protein [Candidatus Pristimantibacillus sp.]|nr:TfoX/Sxy family protein [Candidatus Pristimantibacillus sp.]
MAYNEELTDRVRELLAHAPRVEEKKMFGSVGFMVNGKLCIGVGDHADHIMMVRVGPQKYAEALQHPGAAPAVMRGREQPGYIFLVNQAIASPQDLKYWVNLALAYNKSL